jgi:hypothetical protein
MSLEDKTKDVSNDYYRQDYEGLKSFFYVGLIFTSIIVASKIYDLKYGKTAQERWKADSIKEVMYNDSIKNIGNDIGNDIGSDTVYHLKMVPKTLKY